MFVITSHFKSSSTEKEVVRYQFSPLNMRIDGNSLRVDLLIGALMPFFVQHDFEQESGKQNNQKQM